MGSQAAHDAAKVARRHSYGDRKAIILKTMRFHRVFDRVYLESTGGELFSVPIGDNWPVRGGLYTLERARGGWRIVEDET